MSSILQDKVILITGGSGSFGQRFAETVLRRFNVRKLIILSRDEAKQFDMSQRKPFKDSKEIRFFIGDVRDVERLEMAFREVDYVVHAAALKQITVAEYNPFECIRTNIHGAENVVNAAIRANVKRVVALSTDKAARPINLYGASKLAADKIFVAAKWIVGSAGEPIFSSVRYGNVLGSRGSVVPYFQRLVDEGSKKLPITDPRMTRFWITLQQGVDFVLSTFDLMQGGEIFVPKLPSMAVSDLASLIGGDLEHEIVGIRPGEKLHEVLITEEEARMTLELPDRYVVRPTLYSELRVGYHRDERSVAEDFYYASNNNPDRLDKNRMREMLKQSGIKL